MRARLLRSPVLVGLVAALFVLGILIGIGSVRERDRFPHNVLASVDAGDRPSAVATDGTTVWVADEGSGRVLAFDARRLSVRWVASVGPRPVALAYGFGALWVLDAGDRKLRELDPGDGNVLGTANTSIDPVAVTILDRVWVLAAGNATVDGYNPQTLTQDRSGLPLVAPTSNHGRLRRAVGRDPGRPFPGAADRWRSIHCGRRRSRIARRGGRPTGLADVRGR
jgi:DNA-binding beta-propeller fold protein YncE